MLAPIATAVLRLIVLAGVGYAVFRIRWIQERLLTAFVFLAMNLFFPIFHIQLLGANWETAVDSGWGWMLGFFIGILVLMGIQALLGNRLISRTNLLPTDHPRPLIALFACQNAGFLPLPLIRALAPTEIQVYMFFLILAFNLVLWTFAVSLLSAHAELKVVVNAPLLGLLVGLLLAATGLYQRLPELVQTGLEWIGDIALDVALVALGGILATIPLSRFRLRKDYFWFTLIRQVLYPLAWFLVIWALPLDALRPEMQFGLRLAILIQVVAPPATNLMIIVKNYGSPEQVAYTGGAMLYSYAAAVVTLPAFLLAAGVFFTS